MNCNDPKNNIATKACKTKDWIVYYREFLLDPRTIFTLASGLLLILAVFDDPSGLFSHDKTAAQGSILYLAAALIGSSYIWYLALQGIRERDFTADIPVSIATLAAIAIGQYSAAAVVAVLLLLGGSLRILWPQGQANPWSPWPGCCRIVSPCGAPAATW